MIKKMKNKYKFLKFINLKELDIRWDVKWFLIPEINTGQHVVKLGDYIVEENNKIRPSNYPNREFGILGVSNQVGIFDAYTEKGKKINQPYKIVEKDFLAYNPYRINVGSIGIRENKHKNEYISPAYVVFSCKEELNPNFLYKIFKTEYYNKNFIQRSTTGSVRQNLTYDILTNLKIPLPSLSEQKKLLKFYNTKIQLAIEQEAKAEKLTKSIDEYLIEELGVELPDKKEKLYGKLQFVNFKDLKRWDLPFLQNSFTFNSKFPKIKFIEIIKNFIKDNNGNSLRYEPSKFPDKNIHYIGMEHIEKETGRLLGLNKMKGKKIKSQTVNVPKNYFLYGKLRPYLNKYWNNTTNIDNITCSSEFFVFSTKKQYNSSFFLTLLASKLIQKQIKLITSGARMPRINESQFLELQIPIPPLEKQTEIANHIKNIKTEIKQLQTLAKENRKSAITDFESKLFVKN